jgi:formylglycine-generating enzyme required for sulfatase activity
MKHLSQLAGLALALAAAGCGDDVSHPGGAEPAPVQKQPTAPPEAIPPKVHINAGTVTEGVSIGNARRDINLAAFSVARTPTTVGQYRQCVAAKACTVPEAESAHGTFIEGATYSDVENAEAPVTGATAAQAAAYCTWVGGSLPRPAQWLMAVRGPSVQRASWGDSPASCELVPRQTYFRTSPTSCCSKACEDASTFAVGAHPRSNSQTGLSDALLTRGELLRLDTGSLFPACRRGSEACAVTGASPGMIDRFVPAGSGSAPVDAINFAGFRCVWEGDGT